MIFEIELAHPGRIVLRPLGHALEQAFEEGAHMFVAHGGAAGNALFHATDVFQHFAGRSAAAIAMAIDQEQFLVEVLLPVAPPGAHHMGGLEVGTIGRADALGIVVLRRQEIGGHRAAIDALPVEGFIGHAVGVVPAQLVGDEHIHIRKLHQLRQRGRIAERVRQPEDAGCDPEGLLVIGDAMQDMPHEAFAIGDIGVRLQPQRAFDLEATGLDLRLHALEHLGIVFREIVEQHALIIHEAIVGILLHQRQRRGHGPRHLLPRLADAPQPGDVDMRVAGDGDHRLFLEVCGFIDLRADRLGPAQRGRKAVRIARAEINRA